MTFWQFLKLRFLKILSSTRAECVFGNMEDEDADDSVYIINGVRYVVTACFSKTENKTMKEKISAFIGSDFAHLTNITDKNTIDKEYV